MARLNLLPWREARRAERRREFLAALACAAATGAAMACLAAWLSSGGLRAQQARNAHLERGIGELDRQVAEIRVMQRGREQLLERMRVIQALQGERPVIARVLDQLARAAPEGVFYTEVRRAGEVVGIDGIAESTRRVSGLLRRLDASAWFRDPRLESVRAEPQFGGQAAAFRLTARLVLPGDGDAGPEADVAAAADIGSETGIDSKTGIDSGADIASETDSGPESDAAWGEAW